jgi:CHASE2 domain-containing sensor protein
MEGSFEQGFPVILRISEDGALAETGIQIPGKLPPAPNILESFKNWQSAYRQSVMVHSRIKAKPAQITNVSYRELGDEVAECLNDWLNAESREWQKIRDGLQRSLSDTDEIQFIIQTNDKRLRQLPWHLWNFFEDYSKAEVVLSASEYQPPKKSLTKHSSTKVRILAILGNSQGIDIEKDRAFLEQLSDKAQTKFLVEPQLEELNDQLWEHGWDIFFFAGHSSSQEKGLLQLNQTDAITLDQLRYALKKAIERGLRLAIFNSCDGLGLAQQLSDLHIPQVIVMREPIPDVVAEEFLRHFLADFSGGQSLYASVRTARERLQRLESKFPCATWLPVICQNPAEAPMTWPLPRRPIFSGHSLRTVLLGSVVVTALIMGIRHLGMLQTLELEAFDQSLRLRPVEKPDPRLLIVTVDEADIQYQNRMGMKMRWSLSDRALAQLLKKLEPYQPRTIGLDIYRDFSVDPDHTDLATRLGQDNRLYAVCKVPAPEDGAPEGNRPPPEVPKERLGFSDFVADDNDIVRRQLLHLTPPPTSPCASKYAFSLQIALHYLDSQGIKSDVTPEGYLRIGDVVFKRLKARTSGYQDVDVSGYQVLLNYRSLRSPDTIAQHISLRDVLSDRINPELLESLKHRIVLIGVTAITTADTWKTPYSATALPKQKQIPGVFVQAQMVSHILSAVLNHRPLVWWWSEWVEVLWVWGWSLVGGTIAWCIRQPLYLGLAGITAFVTLIGLCFGIFTQAGWVPFIPSALTLITTQVTVVWWLIARPHLSNSNRHLDSHS